MAKLYAPRTRRPKMGVPSEKSKLTEAMLLQTADDLASERIKLERLRFSDDMVIGLKAVVNRTGLITFHMTYEIGEDRFYMLIGSLNKETDNHVTLDEARDLAKTIKALAAKGINVQDGLHKRLMRELTEKGTAWRLPK